MKTDINEFCKEFCNEFQAEIIKPGKNISLYKNASSPLDEIKNLNSRRGYEDPVKRNVI